MKPMLVTADKANGPTQIYNTQSHNALLSFHCSCERNPLLFYGIGNRLEPESCSASVLFLVWQIRTRTRGDSEAISTNIYSGSPLPLLLHGIKKGPSKSSIHLMRFNDQYSTHTQRERYERTNEKPFGTALEANSTANCLLNSCGFLPKVVDVLLNNRI